MNTEDGIDIDELKDLVGLAVRKELQRFLSEIAKLLQSRPDDNPTEVQIANVQHSSYCDKNEQSVSFTNSKLPRVLNNAETKKVKLIFGDFLEHVHGGDEEKLNDAVDFWSKALNHVNVGRTIERLRYAPPPVSKVHWENG